MQVYFVILPFVLMLALWRKRIGNWRETFLTSAIVWGTGAVCLTEVLSSFNAINAEAIFRGWIVIAGLVVCATPLLKRSTPKDSTPGDSSVGVPGWQIVFISAVLAVIAWMGPPNNFDSLVYHMSRIAHWIQDGNVAFYPTQIGRQLQMAPGAEYLILNMDCVNGNNQWANMVQWFAYAGCAIGISSVAGLLGASGRGQIIAALFAATLPMACLQAVTTQNDLVCAFWIICLAWSALRIDADRAAPAGVQWRNFMLCGLSLGLALLTKSTSYIYAFPIILALTIVTLYRKRAIAIIPLAVVASLSVTINLPTFARNYRATHTLLGNGGFPAGADRYVNVNFGIGTTFSNILRNIALELVLPLDSNREAVEHFVRATLVRVHLDPDDPKTTFQTPFKLSGLNWNHEDTASNPLHTVIIFAAAVTLVVVNRRAGALVWIYCGAIVLGSILFCSYLRWQPWHSRLHLPYLILSGALVGVVVDKYWNRRLFAVVGAILPIAATPWILFNALHPLVGSQSIFVLDRQTRYFVQKPEAQQHYKSVVDFIESHHCLEVGLTTTGDSWEYPLQMMLHERMPNLRIETYKPNAHTTPQALHTLNKGFDPKLKPYAIVKIDGYNIGVIDFVGPDR